MNSHAHLRRRTCLGFALGLAADAALPRAAGAMPDAGLPGGTYKTILSFGKHEGRQPGGVVLGSGGLLLGSTEGGGELDLGTVYRLDAHRRVQVLHEFRGGPDDGAGPAGAPAEGDDGAFYGVTGGGGAEGVGVAWRLGPDARWTVLHHFGVAPDNGNGSFDGLLFASDGQFYGTTVWGGKRDRGLVYRLGKDGTFTPLWHMGAKDEPYTPRATLIEGADGRLYGSSWGGGPKAGGTIYSLEKDGSDHRVLYSFVLADGWIPHAALVQATDGLLYGTTRNGGMYARGTAFRLAPDGSGFELLHEFGGRADDRYPETPLVEVEPGVFVGAAAGDRDAISMGGALFALTSDGGHRNLHRFARRTYHGVPDGEIPTGPMCRLPSGELVGSCAYGGVAQGRNTRGTLWFARAPDGGWSRRAVSG